MESWSDRTSFANRKGRTTMDANYYVCKVFSGTDAPEWLVKADVKKCYESISHEWIRENIPLADRIKNEFLRAGYFLSNKYVEKDQGIGIGCRLSPFLVGMLQNIILCHRNQYPSPLRPVSIKRCRAFFVPQSLFAHYHESHSVDCLHCCGRAFEEPS